MTIAELKQRGIECYADNDGGLWYYNPETKRIETVKE